MKEQEQQKRQKSRQRTSANARQDKSNPTDEQLETRWNEIRSTYRQRYPELTDEDVQYRKGNFNDMLGRISDRTGQSRQHLQDEIRNWESEGGSSRDDESDRKR